MIRLEQTCSGCPEQYEAFDEQNNLVGYLRLRHGFFYVKYPDVGGEVIYEASPQGDGSFLDEERDYYLRFAVDAIMHRIKYGEIKRPEAPDVDYEVSGLSKWTPLIKAAMGE